jgi:hypothetical protein
MKGRWITRLNGFEPRTQRSRSLRWNCPRTIDYFGYYPKAPSTKPDLPWKIRTTTKNTRMIRRSDRRSVGGESKCAIYPGTSWHSVWRRPHEALEPQEALEPRYRATRANQLRCRPRRQWLAAGQKARGRVHLGKARMDAPLAWSPRAAVVVPQQGLYPNGDYPFG